MIAQAWEIAMSRLGILILLLGCVGCATTTVDYDPASGHTSCTTRIGPATIIGVNINSEIIGPRYSLTVTEPYGLYPGRTTYAAIGGQRWSGPERIQIGPEMRSALLRGGQLDLSWSPWPSGGRQKARVNVDPEVARKALTCAGAAE